MSVPTQLLKGRAEKGHGDPGHGFTRSNQNKAMERTGIRVSQDNSNRLRAEVATRPYKTSVNWGPYKHRP